MQIAAKDRVRLKNLEHLSSADADNEVAALLQSSREKFKTDIP